MTGARIREGSGGRPCEDPMLQEWARASTISCLFLCHLTKGWLIICFKPGQKLATLFNLQRDILFCFSIRSLNSVFWLKGVLTYFCKVMSQAAMRVLTCVCVCVLGCEG